MDSNSSLNHIYRSVWNEALGAMVAVAELAPSRGKGKSGVSGSGAKGALSLSLPSLACSAFAIALAWCGVVRPVFANPTGGVAIHGQAAVTSNGNQMLVTTQNGAGTNHSAINWQSFSIPTGSGAYFQQPNASSTSINRVVTNTPSLIFGTLGSNGKLVLVNQSGITVGAGAVVDTAGFTASALRMTDADAIAGKLRFGDAAVAAGDVQVQGSILARNGDVVLMGSKVTAGQSALIQAPNGNTILAAGQQVEITGRGLEGISMHVQAPTDSAVNLGTLTGDAVGIFAGTLKHSGNIQATAVSTEGGKVFLKAADSVTVDGTVSVKALNGLGGSLQATANKVMLKSGAIIDVSGTNGGGEALIGGGLHGTDARISNAQQTTVEAGAIINADATQLGDGGTIAVWSDGTTQAHGTLTANAGRLGGNGGMIETSGHQLDFAGVKVSAGALKGRAGTWLIDPENVTIDADAAMAISAVLSIGGVSGYGTNVTIDTAACSYGVCAPGVGNITVDSAIKKDAPSSGSAADVTLTLNAANNIFVNAAISSNSGALNVEMTAGNSITANPGGALATNGGYVSLSAVNNLTIAEINTSGSVGSAGDITFSTVYGGISQLGPIKGWSDLFINSGGDVHLENAGNEIGYVSGSTGYAADVFVRNILGVGFSGLNAAGGVTLRAAPTKDLVLKGDVSSAQGRNIRLISNDGSVATDDSARSINSNGGDVFIAGYGGSVDLGGGGVNSSANQGNAGKIEIYAAQNISLGTVTADGTIDYQNDGGSGGSITIHSTNGNVSVQTINTSGADGVGPGSTGNGTNGGDSGSVTITANRASGPSTIHSIFATPGNPDFAYSGSMGGGGSITITAAHNVDLYGSINAPASAITIDTSGVLSHFSETIYNRIKGQSVYLRGSEVSVINVTSLGGDINITSTVGNLTATSISSNGSGMFGLDAGNVTIHAHGDLTVDTIDASGNSGSIGGNGGAVEVVAGYGVGGSGYVDLISVDTSGGDGANSTGGNGGDVRLTANGGVVAMGGAINAYGGSSFSEGDGGNAGNVAIDATGTNQSNASSIRSIDNQAGTGSSSGLGGTITINTAHQLAFFDSIQGGGTIGVTSSDGGIRFADSNMDIVSNGSDVYIHAMGTGGIVQGGGAVAIYSHSLSGGSAGNIGLISDNANVSVDYIRAESDRTNGRVTTPAVSISAGTSVDVRFIGTSATAGGERGGDVVIRAGTDVYVDQSIQTNGYTATRYVGTGGNGGRVSIVAGGDVSFGLEGSISTYGGQGDLGGGTGGDIGVASTGGSVTFASGNLVQGRKVTIQAYGDLNLPISLTAQGTVLIKSDTGLLDYTGGTYTNTDSGANLYVSLLAPNAGNKFGGAPGLSEKFTFKQYGVSVSYDAAIGLTPTVELAGTGSALLYANAPTLAASGLNTTKQYDGDRLVAATSGQLPALVSDGNEVIAFTAATFEYDDRNVGSAKAIYVNGVLDVTDPTIGTSGSTPVYGYSTRNLISNAGEVTAAPLTITANEATKTYDGTAVGTSSFTAGLIAGDTASGGTFTYVDGNGAANANAGIGNKNLRVSGVTINDGNGGLNYAVTFVDNTTSTISPALITAIAANRAYDGTTTVSATDPNTTFGISGLVAGESLNVAGSGSVFDKNVGNGRNFVNVTPFSLVDRAGTGGGLASNYDFSNAAQTANISQRALSTWTGGGTDLLWSNSANWAGGVLPDGNNVLTVVIPQSAKVTFDSSVGTTSLQSIFSQGSINVLGGTLDVSNSLNTADFTQTAGAVTGAGSFTVGNSFNQTGGSIAVAGPVAITQVVGDLVVGSVSGASVALKAPAGSITQTASSVTQPSGIQTAGLLSADAANGVTLTDAGNAVSSFSATVSGAGNVAFTNKAVLDVTGITIPNGNLVLDNTGALTISGDVIAKNGKQDITAHSPITVNGNLISSGDITLAALTASAASNITVNGNLTSTSGGISAQAYNNYVQNAKLFAALGITVSAGGTITFGPTAFSVGNPLNYTANGVAYTPPWVAAILTGGPTSFVADFLNQFQTALDAQMFAADDPLGKKQRNNEGVVVEGNICTP